MNIYTSEQYEDGLCLITTDNFTGLVNVEFLNKDVSIKKYEEWYDKPFDNVLSVSDPDYPPQWIYKSSISQITSFNSIANGMLEKTDLSPDDVTIPIMGGIRNFKFNELLIRLWDQKEPEHYKYILVIKNYYKELFKSIEAIKIL